MFTEASLHAWKNLGLDQETKEYLETNFSPDEAYLMAICFIPWIKYELEFLRRDFGSDSRVHATQRAWDNDPPALYPILQAIHKKTDSKLPGMLKSDAAKIAKMTWQEAEDYFRDLSSKVKSPEPPGYNDSGSAFCKSLNGWSWHRVSDNACKDHEGALMQHCGANDKGDMYSLRDLNGKPHITAEIDFTSAPWSIYQFKGKQNDAPAKALWPYALNFLEQMFEENGQAMWYEGYEWDDDDFMAEVEKTGFIHVVRSDGLEGFDDPAMPEDERAHYGGNQGD